MINLNREVELVEQFDSYLEGGMNKKQQKAFKDLLDKDKKVKVAFEEFKEISEDVSLLSDQYTPPDVLEFKDQVLKVDAAKKRRKVILYPLWRVAALLVLTIGMAWVGLNQFQKYQRTHAMQTAIQLEIPSEEKWLDLSDPKGSRGAEMPILSEAFKPFKNTLLPKSEQEAITYISPMENYIENWGLSPRGLEARFFLANYILNIEDESVQRIYLNKAIYLLNELDRIQDERDFSPYLRVVKRYEIQFQLSLAYYKIGDAESLITAKDELDQAIKSAGVLQDFYRTEKIATDEAFKKSKRELTKMKKLRRHFKP